MKTPRKSHPTKPAAPTATASRRPASSVRDVHPTRDIKALTRVLLAVRAGGRCEFDGHNKYLFRHTLTLTEGNFSQAAHIVAFKEKGPRGKVKRPTAAELNSIKNLMLLCGECHHLIDAHPDRYPVKTLHDRSHGAPRYGVARVLRRSGGSDR